MAREESLNRGPLNKSLKDRRERNMQMLREEPSSKGGSKCEGPEVDHVRTAGRPMWWTQGKQRLVGTGEVRDSDYPEPKTRIGSRIFI